LVNPLNNKSVDNSNTQVSLNPVANSSTNDEAKADALRLQQELNDRTKFMSERIGGANKNLQSSIDTYEGYKNRLNLVYGMDLTVMEVQI